MKGGEMCKPASFIVTKGPKAWWSEKTDSHSDIISDEIARLKRENDATIAAACTTLSNMFAEIARLKAALTLKRSAPDDYEIMLKSLQANLISVRDQRDEANAQLRRANKTLARLTKRNIELRLELDEHDKMVTAEEERL